MTDYNQFLAARGLVVATPPPPSPPAPSLPDAAAPPGELDAAPPARRIRCDGFSPARQAVFVEAIAGGCTVAEAAGQAGMSPSAAYALRDRPDGRAFAIGWDAASIAARRALADECLSRAMHGYWETADYDGRQVRRHKYDNRHARAMLTRLDKLAQSQRDDAVARLAAADLGGFVDALETGDDTTETMLAERAARGLASRGAYGTSSPLSPLVQETVEDEPPFDPSRPHFLQEDDGLWWTDAPPPPGFDGETRKESGYTDMRTCTEEEHAWFGLEREDEDADEAETYRAWLESEGIDWMVEESATFTGEESNATTSADTIPAFVMPGLTRHPSSLQTCQVGEEDGPRLEPVLSGVEGAGVTDDVTVVGPVAAASPATPHGGGSPPR